MRLKQYLAEALTFQDEMVGMQGRQKDGRITAYIDNTPVGWLDYSDWNGEISIKMVEVEPQHRRKGIGKDLILKLQKMYPTTELSLGMHTGEGAKLVKSLKSSLYVDKARIKKMNQLEKELKDLEREEKQLVKKLKPGSTDNDKIGDRLNAISDRQYEIEQEIRNIR
jgi:GNAT superfamily N-acetyltransferase